MKKTFPFKCHRVEDNVFSVNDIKFHPVHNIFASVGSDGSYHFWDKDARVRLSKIEPTLCPITCCAYSKDGNMFSYASCYDWSKGYEYYNKDDSPHILIHNLSKEEVTPKSSK